MKKFTLLIVLFTTCIFANINAIVSILPQKTFVQAIGGDKVDVALMVQPGNSPHTYEPKPSQMIEITKADLYFAIDVEFENVWLPKFQSLNQKMKVIDLADNIHKIDMGDAQCEHDHDDHGDKGADPHIWTSPKNVKIMAKHIFEALSAVDISNTAYYKDNLNTFLQEIEETDTRIKEILASVKKDNKFMVFHPSWGYFAKAYHLKQIAVEVEGKEPKPKELIDLLKEAKEERVKAIFTQPEFSDTVAHIIAKELKIPVVKVSPLAADWSQNLINIAKTIAGKK
ncbi:MAG: zinc ABC transporter substrate-binding protein [Campylobacterota bacterium]|nr:zinc ABC transporter substrate-binding protein [Campylobacterota bacterium]